MLFQHGTVLESLPLISPGNCYGVFRSDTLLLADKRQSIARKFKIQFQSIHAAADCVEFLKSYIPIKDLTKPDENPPMTLGQMYSRLLEADAEDQIPNPEPLPLSFPLEEVVKICILDPTFPDLVARVAATVSKIDQSNK